MITVSKRLINASIKRKSLVIEKRRYDLDYDSIVDDKWRFPSIDIDEECAFDDEVFSDSAELVDDSKQASLSPLSAYFDKIEIATPFEFGSSTRVQSGLSVLLSRQSALASRLDPRPELHDTTSRAPLVAEVYCSDFAFDRGVFVSVPIESGTVAVSAVIDEAMLRFRSKFTSKALRSADAAHYELRCIDDDDLDGLNAAELCAADLDPILKRSRNILDFVDLRRRRILKLALCRCASAEDDADDDSEEAEESEDAEPKKMELAQIGKEKEQIFVRIGIVRPLDECSVLLSMNSASVSTLRLRDLFGFLNKKRQSNAFSPHCFEFHDLRRSASSASPSRHSPSVPLPNGLSVLSLAHRKLVILPKRLNPHAMRAKDRAEVFEYELVRIANESARFEATKLRKNKLRYPVVFRVEPTENQVVLEKHKTFRFGPIVIKRCRIDVIEVEGITDIRTDKNTNCLEWSISYFLHKTHKMQTFEMDDKRSRDKIVRKLKYLCVLAKLRKGK